MARTDIFSEQNGIVFSAISTPRRIRLFTPGNANASRPWDYVSVYHRADTVVYVGLNGKTASSTAATTVEISSTQAPNYMVDHTQPLSIFSHATSLSIQATGSTAVVCGIILGRY